MGVVKIDSTRFYGSKVAEDTNELVDEVYKVLAIMGVSSIEMVQFVVYQQKDVAQMFYGLRKDSRKIAAGPIEWETFQQAFLDMFFSRQLMEDMYQELVNLISCYLSIEEYALKFIVFYKYEPSFVENTRDFMNRFMMGVFDKVKVEYRMDMLVDFMEFEELRCLLNEQKSLN